MKFTNSIKFNKQKVHKSAKSALSHQKVRPPAAKPCKQYIHRNFAQKSATSKSVTPKHRFIQNRTKWHRFVQNCTDPY